MNVTLEVDVASFRRNLAGFSDRRIAAAISTALTRTAWELREDWNKQLRSNLQQPTPYTMRSVKVQTATAQKLEAATFVSQQGRPGEVVPAEYLGTQERGGDRNLRKFERALVAKGAMPSGHRALPGQYAKIDGFGNVTRSQIVQVLNQIAGADVSVGYRRVIGKTEAKRAQAARRSGRLYVAIPKKIGQLEAGIYERKQRQLLPVFFFVDRTTYRKKLNLVERGKSMVVDKVTAQIERAIREHAARLGLKR